MFHIYDKRIYKRDVTCSLPDPCHKLSHLLGPHPPSSVTYFMDGPEVKDKATSQLLCKACGQWRKSGGTGRDCPTQSFDLGDSSVDSSQSSDFGGSVPGLAS